jgi:organic solute transporter subunit alpha
MIYIEGETNFIAIAGKESFTLKSPPLCCCCPFKRTPITKKDFNLIRFLIFQMPVAHITIFLAMNLIYIESPETFDNVILYFIPFIALTVLGGIWGLNLAIRTFAPFYVNLKLPQKYLAFQLVLFFCKIQPILLNVIMKQVITTCTWPLTILVKRHSELARNFEVVSVILTCF